MLKEPEKDIMTQSQILHTMQKAQGSALATF